MSAIGSDVEASSEHAGKVATYDMLIDIVIKLDPHAHAPCDSDYLCSVSMKVVQVAT